MSRLCCLFFLIYHTAVLSCIYGVSANSTHLCLPEHHDSLLVVRRHLRFPNTSKVATWVPGTDCCRWDGVNCDAQSGQVTHLNLWEASLSGEIHPALFNLTSLESLDLSYNNFNTHIPSHGFERLANLTDLILFDAGFVGQIPIGMSRLSNLVRLYIGSSGRPKLEDPDFGTLVKDLNRLEDLFLDGVNISGVQNNWCHALWSLPRSIKGLNMWDCTLTGPLDCSLLGNGPTLRNFSSLSILDLSYNSLAGLIPALLFSHPSLSNLALSNNKLSGFSKKPLDVSSSLLKYIFLSGNTFRGRIPQFLFQLPRLLGLYLDNNQFSGSMYMSTSVDLHDFYIDLSFNQLSHLETPLLWSPSPTSTCSISIQANRLKGPIPLPPCYVDGFLDYSNNSLSGSITSKFGVYLKNTLAIWLSKNNLTGEIPNFFCDVTRLQLLDLSHNNLHGPLPSCLMKLHHLRVLVLEGNKFTGKIPSGFHVGCSLEYINLNANMLEGGLPVSFANCESLKNIDIGNNKIEGQFPFWIAKLHKLRVLVLSNNKFKGLLPLQWNDTFHDLQILDLSSNYFEGMLPVNLFRNLKAMQSNNMTSSDLYYQITYVISTNTTSYYQDFVTIHNKNFAMDLQDISKDTIVFDLSYNQFEGSIPDEIGELLSIKILNFSHNQFIGPIPQSFGKLKQLESLDLSCNKISGVIPMEMTSMTYLEVLNLSYNFLTGKIPTSQQFSTFTNSSYIGNKGLCGTPISKLCEVENKRPQQPSHKDEDSRPNWKLISIEIGFLVGVLLWNGTLLLCPNGRRYFNNFVMKYYMYL